MAVDLAIGDVIQTRVVGVAAGQAVINVFSHFVRNTVSGTVISIEEFQESFITIWQGVCDVLSAAYAVTLYQSGRYSALLGPAAAPRTRFNAVVQTAGVGADVGGVAGAWLPTYATVNARKNTEGPQTTVPMFGAFTPTTIAAEKSFKGFTRLSPIVEADTQAAQGNTLEAASRTAFDAALEELVDFPVVGLAAVVGVQLCIVSTLLDGAARPGAGAGGLPLVAAYQPVASYTVATLLGSQTTRKQHPSGS
jgi:hypothetical protein